jgi:PadR family transcriptional regulator, regulatory protein PadR
MKGSSLGEFEEIVLLTVAVLYDESYGVAIQEYLKNKCGKARTISTIHVVLHRLEQKGFLESRLDGVTIERGGRRKLLFRVTKSGQKALAEARNMRNELWSLVPKAAFSLKTI